MTRWRTPATIGLLLGVACGGGSTTGSGTGGARGTGGASATGGATATGGNSGSGGASATGGTFASGGANASGGATATGGAAATGGAGATGGRAATGGTTATGGRAATGGVTATGGNTGTGGRAATGGASGAGGATACTPCTTYGAAMMTGKVMPTDLANLSGMAVSWKNPNVLFAHNDMTQAHVFALDPMGRQLARYALPNAGAVDIEDMGIGPCGAAGGNCIYLADIGGNLGARAEFAIFRLTEPAVPTTPSTATTQVTFERFPFTYPDGQHNAEGLLVEPKTGALYVITKVAAGMPSAVYALPNPLTTTGNMARKITDLTVPKSGDSPATSASAHPCGTGFLLRTSEHVYEFRIQPGAAFETAFTATPVSITSATEPQSEAISYRPDGRGYFSCGETAAPPIFEVSCTN